MEPLYDRIAGFVLRILLVAAFAMTLLTVPNMNEKSIAPETRYLPALGNNIFCKQHDESGREYVGWIAGQSDSSTAPVKGGCVYARKV